MSQKRSNMYIRLINLLFAVVAHDGQIVGFIVGIATQKFVLTAWCVAAGLVVNVLLFVPGWPMHKRHPVHFQPAGTR